MTKESFSIKEAVNFGWETVKGNILFFFALSFISVAVSLLPEVIQFALGADDAKETSPAIVLVALLLFIIFVVLWTMVQLGYIKIALQFCRGEKSSYADLFNTYRLALPYFIASLLYGLIVIAGSILLIVPGIIFGIRFSLFGFCIVEKDAGILGSLKQSYRLTQGSGMKLFLFFLALMGVNFLGALLLGIGLFLTIPLSVVACGSVYLKLAGEPAGSPAVVPAGRQAKAPLKVAPLPKRSDNAEKRPSSPGAPWRSRGLCCLLRSDYTGAAEEFTKAVEMDPRYGAAYHSRGFAYYQAGDYQQAKNDFDKAIALDSDYAKDAGSFMYRGLTLEKLGEKREALEDMKMAVTLGNRGAGQYLTQMSEVKDQQ